MKERYVDLILSWFVVHGRAWMLLKPEGPFRLRNGDSSVASSFHRYFVTISESFFSAIKSYLPLPQNDKDLTNVILRRPPADEESFFLMMIGSGSERKILRAALFCITNNVLNLYNYIDFLYMLVYSNIEF